jgi:cytochrome b561
MRPHADIPGKFPDDSSAHYSRTAMMFHWTIAVLILFEFASALSFSLFNPGDAGYFHSAYRLHMSAGMVLLVFSASCIAWRLMHKYPPLPRDMHAATRALATLALILLYVFIISVPAIGWAILSTRNTAVGIFGKLHWPNIAYLGQMTYGQRVRLHGFLVAVHTKLAYLGIGLVGLHVAASLYHHFYRRDDVLTRMLPTMKPKH